MDKENFSEMETITFIRLLKEYQEKYFLKKIERDVLAKALNKIEFQYRTIKAIRTIGRALV